MVSLVFRLPICDLALSGLPARVAVLGLCALAGLGAAQAETVPVATVEELGQALADALPGTEIVLAPGDYGPLLLRGGGGTAEAPILLRSADPADPAVQRDRG